MTTQRWGLVPIVVACLACEPAPPAGGAPTASAPSLAAATNAAEESTAVDSPAVASSLASSKGSPPAAPAAPPGAGEGCRDLSGPDPGTPLTLPPDPRPQGFHVSTHAPWRSLEKRGLRFAFAAASLGMTRNEDFKDNWAMAKTCGIPRGAYHFLSPKHDATSQAKLFLSQLDGDLGELPMVLDAEQTPGCKSACCERDCTTWEQLIATWLAVVRKETKREPTVYTVRGWWKECLCNTSRFADRPLWLGAYPNIAPTERPGFGGWQRWQFFHHRGNVRFAGGVVDLDLFAGDRDALSELIARQTKRGP